MANAVEAVVVFAMRLGAHTIWTAIAFGVALAPACVSAEESFDTEHIFGFMIGTDVGNPGEREFQSQTTGRFGKGGTYRALQQEVEIEVVPLPNFRIEVGGTATLHDITGVPDIDDRRQFNFQGASLDLRYRLLDRGRAPFGLTVAAELHGDRIDETSGAKGRMYGTDFTLAFDRELVPNFVIAALNLIYQPEWARFEVAGAVREEFDRSARRLAAWCACAPIFCSAARCATSANMRASASVSSRARRCLSVRPPISSSRSSRGSPLSWSMQAWGRPAGSSANLDLVNFERHQARLVFGVNF